MKGKHIHKFNKYTERKVHIKGGETKNTMIITGVDTIKMWQCKCGAKQAFDLERIKA